MHFFFWNFYWYAPLLLNRIGQKEQRLALIYTLTIYGCWALFGPYCSWFDTLAWVFHVVLQTLYVSIDVYSISYIQGIGIMLLRFLLKVA